MGKDVPANYNIEDQEVYSVKNKLLNLVRISGDIHFYIFKKSEEGDGEYITYYMD